MYNVQEDVDEFQNFLMWTKSLLLFISTFRTDACKIQLFYRV